jgi:hypothetical protein
MAAFAVHLTHAACAHLSEDFIGTDFVAVSGDPQKNQDSE